MKVYRNGMRATGFSKKQINVLFAKAKNHELQIEAWFMKRMYSLADFYGYDENRSIEHEEQGILLIIEAVFSGDLEKTQSLINRETENIFDTFIPRYQKTFDKSYIA